MPVFSILLLDIKLDLRYLYLETNFLKLIIFSELCYIFTICTSFVITTVWLDNKIKKIAFFNTFLQIYWILNIIRKKPLLLKKRKEKNTVTYYCVHSKNKLVSIYNRRMMESLFYWRSKCTEKQMGSNFFIQKKNFVVYIYVYSWRNAVF